MPRAIECYGSSLLHSGMTRVVTSNTKLDYMLKLGPGSGLPDHVKQARVCFAKGVEPVL